MENPPYSEVRALLFDGEVIPFLGAGMSTGVREPSTQAWTPDAPKLLPRAGELAEHLMKAMSLEEDSRDLAAVAHHYESTLGRVRLSQKLHRIFAEDKPLRPLHKLLAEVENLPLVVTTNYDRLIERALEEKEREYDLVVQGVVRNELLYKPHGGTLKRLKKAELELELVRSTRTVVYKLHGSIMPEDDSDEFLITDGDYLEFLLRMSQRTPLPAPIGARFNKSNLLFLGYGLRDWNVRLVLSRVRPFIRRSRSLDYRSWAIDEKPSAIEMRFWDQQGVTIYPMALDLFAQRLRDAA